MKIKLTTSTGYIENQFESYTECIDYIKQLGIDGIDVVTYSIILDDKYKSDDMIDNEKLINRGIEKYENDMDAFLALIGGERITFH